MSMLPAARETDPKEVFMGRAKERLLDLEERGFGEVPDKYVCDGCFENKGIKDFIKRNAKKDICSYCGTKSHKPIATSLENVIGLIVQSIRRVYEDPAESLPYESSEGGYFGDVYNVQEVLDEMELELTEDDQHKKNNELYNDLTMPINQDQWTLRGGLSGRQPGDNYVGGWKRFTKQVKHNSRYVFSIIKYKRDDEDIIVPSKILPEILNFIKDNKMVHEIKKGKIFYRARAYATNESVKNTAEDLGAPKARYSVTNRMSPAGIPMFYGAIDRETALKEIRAIKNKNRHVKIAKFKLLEDISIVNFNKPPEFCFFDEKNKGIDIDIKVFLHYFVNEIARPIIKDGHEHVDYVPSQIVTEYLKYKCVDSQNKRIKGVFYPSSLKTKGICCALFIRNRNCVDKDISSKGNGERKDKAYVELVDVENVKL